jgi:VIT1/CCC1 family predicted Fe2+/Mn2+ transporter
VRGLVFSANDGLVAAFAVISGVHGADQTSKVILIAGMAELIGGMIAMGLGAYLSVKSALEYFHGERAREEYEVEHYPERERHEVYEIYREKGFEPPILIGGVVQICDD